MQPVFPGAVSVFFSRLGYYFVQSSQTAVMKGGNTAKLLKSPGEIIGVMKSQGLPYSGNAVIGLVQSLLGSAHKLIIDVLAYRNTNFLPKAFLQITL